MPGVPDDWVKTALEVTGHFEDSADPLGAVTGNFDGMGISLGVLQWNIGSHSLQSMVKAIGRDEVRQLMPQFGDQLWQACNADVLSGLAICKGWQNGAKLRPDPLRELKAFTRSDAFVAQQVQSSAAVAAEAWQATRQYAAADPAYGQVTKALFCWFFDLFTQNGGLKTLSYSDVHAFIELNGVAGSIGIVCDWLGNRPATMTGALDGKANATLWRTVTPESSVSLLILSYLRSQRSKPDFKADVLNRKGTVAVQQGWVHREKHDLRPFLQ